MYYSFLKAKLSTTITEISIGNEKKIINKKSYAFGQVSYLTSTFSVVMYVDTVFCAFVRSFANE